jgi:CRP/FNR family transcriptional regulator, anaerobic regulatory protein
MTLLEQYIKNFFGIAPYEELQLLSNLFTEKALSKNEFLLKADKQCNELCFVQSGLLRIYANTAGKEVTQWISTPGFFAVDLSSFIFDKPARWYIQALTDVTLYTITKQNYNTITSFIPQWPVLEKLFLVKCFTMLEDRIFTHLSMSAEERYQLFFEQQPELFNQVPLQYIASILGITPETLSRIRKKQL